KAFHSLDGQGIKMLQKSGLTVAIITGRTSAIVQKRAAALGIHHVIQGREDKLTALDELLHELRKTLSIDYHHIAHMGDDYPDLPLIRRVGLGMTPSNGHWVVKQHAHWQSTLAGGCGAVRQACDLIMLAQGRFESALSPYL
ncbi:MAG: HAD hydrolase family protein, partial [Pseudomonadota bacterium]